MRTFTEFEKETLSLCGVPDKAIRFLDGLYAADEVASYYSRGVDLMNTFDAQARKDYAAWVELKHSLRDALLASMALGSLLRWIVR